jgi:AcrR family transcriptional regulator
MDTSTASAALGRRHLPVQRRSTEKVDAILAAARLIMADPDAELTVRGIEDRVSFSVGTIYRYFESLEAIVDAVLQQHADAAEERLDDLLVTLEPDSLDELFRQLIEALIALYRENPHFTQLQVAGEYRVRYAEIEERSNRRLVESVADKAIAAGLMPNGAKSRTRLLVHWSAVGAAFRIAFQDNPRGNRTVLAEARQMVGTFATTY